MKRRVLAAGTLGALLLGLLNTGGSPLEAQPAPEGFAPISIYALDDGVAVDSIDDPALKTADGTVFGAVPTADRHGNPTGALLFDGVDDYVQTNEESNINPLTFSVWFRADDISAEHSIVDSDASGAYGHSLIIGYDDPNNAADTPFDGSLDVQYHNAFWDTGVTVQPGVWTQAFVTFSDAQMRLYVGTETTPTVLVAEQPYDTSVGFDGSTFRFGRHNEGDAQWFKGAMDDIRFYDKALSQAEITEVAPVERPIPERPVNPLLSNAWGDVHIRTPDGLAYDFQVVGDYILAQSDPDVAVQARQEWWATNPSVSVNTAAALNVAGDRLEFYIHPEQSYLLNGQPTDMPADGTILPNGGFIYSTGFDSRVDLTIVWPGGETGARVVIFGTNNIDIGVARLGGSRTFEGVLGNLDRDPTNDLQVRGGDALTAPATFDQLVEFGNSWLVPSDASLFSVPSATPPAAPQEVLTIESLDEDARTTGAATCQAAGIEESLALENCTYDVAATGEESFVESAAVYQEAALLLPADEPAVVRGLVVESAPETTVAAETTAAPTTEPATTVADTTPTETTTAPTASDDDGFPIIYVLIGGGVLLLLLIIIVLSRRGKKS